ncbi:MAG: hypothetical protein NZ922_05300 [Candidatus Methanomethyliaceae archaeon]|nr:hypothetical protein [Candidatus Methanomethyliaceae archaeon]MDW7971537.1 acetolactate synthase [Nitrososphaerota archaeon]
MKQISVFLENRPGRLANLLKILKENNIKVFAMGIAEAGNYGIVRLILDNPDRAIEVLRNMNMAVNKSEVIIVSIELLPEVSKVLGEAGINIDYAYTMDGRKVVLKVSDEIKASEVLRNLGMEFIV